MSVFVFAQVLKTDTEHVQKLGYTEYRTLLLDGKIESAVLKKNQVHATLKIPETTVINGVSKDYTKFWVVLSPTIDSDVTAEWDAMGIVYEFQDETRDWVDYLFQILPWFLIIFFWTPPHTWALAMRYKEDYKAAGVPMLPVVATEQQVTKQILIYTWLTVAATLALALAAGWLYAAVAILAGTWFLVMAHQLNAGVRRGEPVKPLKLFLQSNNYLAVVFCALAVDSALALPTLLTV